MVGAPYLECRDNLVLTWARGGAFLIVSDRPTQPRQLAYPDIEVTVAFGGKKSDLRGGPDDSEVFK